MYKKLKTAYIVLLMVGLTFVSYAPQAHAIPVVVAGTLQLIFDIGTWVKSTMNEINTSISSAMNVFNNTKEYVLDPLAWAISKSQIHGEANAILTQIRGGAGSARRETGGALFVTDWEKVARNAVENQRKFFLQELAVTKKIDPAFQETLLGAFSENPNKSVFNRLRSTFGRDTGCTGPSCLEDFLGDFSKGGWAGWNSIVSNPGNNPYRSYLELRAEKERREESARQARINEALASQGALGTQDCVDELSAEAGEDFVGPPAPPEDQNQTPAEEQNQSQAPPPEQAPLKLQKCKVTRPGSTVATDLSKVLGGTVDMLQNVDEVSELIMGAFANLVSSLRSQGVASDRETINVVKESSDALKKTNIEQSKKTIDELSLSVTRSLGDLDDIWKIKVKSLDLIDEISPGVIYEINETQKNVDAGKACANKPEIYEQLPSSLADAKKQKDVLIREVGYLPIPIDPPPECSIREGKSGILENGCPPLGYYEGGGLYSEELFKKQADLEYLDKVIESNGDTEPSSILASDEVTVIFEEPPKLASSERLRMAQQIVGREVGKVSALLMQIGTPDGAQAEQREINQKMLNQRQTIRTCSLQ